MVEEEGVSEDASVVVEEESPLKRVGEVEGVVVGAIGEGGSNDGDGESDDHSIQSDLTGSLEGGGDGEGGPRRKKSGGKLVFID